MTQDETIYVLSFSQLERLLIDGGKAIQAARRARGRIEFPTSFVPLAQFSPTEWQAIVAAIVETKLDELRRI